MPVLLECQMCHKTFTVSPSKAIRANKYCSHACHWAAHAPVPLTCLQCGQAFLSPPSTATRLKYCSRACYTRSPRVRVRPKRSDTSVLPDSRTCHTCHETKPRASFYHMRRKCRACMAAYAKNRHNQHPEKQRANNKKWREKNPQKIYAKVLRWQRKHPEKIAAQAAKRRARKLKAPINDFTAAQWLEMLIAYQHRCVYCRRKMQHLTQDHITPLSKGGNHTKSNIVPACKSCNAKKNVGPPLLPIQPLLL